MAELTSPEDAVQRLVRQSEIGQALAWLETSGERFAEQITELSQIPAPTFAEEQRGAYVARRLAALGVEQIHSDEAGNVLGCLAGDAARPGLALMAHLDTVFGPAVDVTVSRQASRLYGPGIGDNGAGVAGVLLMLEAMQIAGLRLVRPLWLVFSVGEEGLGDLRGARAAMQHLTGRVEAVIAVEGALLGRVTHQGVGSRRWRVTFRGPGGHSWHDFGRPSAINAAARSVAAISRLNVPSDPRTTYNIGRIEGGTGVNVIAAEASFLLDMRSIGVSELAALGRRAEEAIQRAARDEDVAVQIELAGDRPAGMIPRDHRLVQTSAAVLRHLGLEPRFEAASTDANIPLSHGIPAVTVGITRGGGVHTEGEWIEIEPATLGVRQLLLLTLAAVGGL
jgi:tripeptide aminopeptidase